MKIVPNCFDLHARRSENLKILEIIFRGVLLA